MLDTSRIVGLQVIGITDGKVVGQVSEVVCDLATGKLIGLILGEGAAEKGVLADEIRTIGEDAVMVPSSASARRLSELPELLQRRRGPGRRPLAVITDDGRKLGSVSRVWIDPHSKLVTRYEVSAGLWRDLASGALILPVIPGSIHGEDTLIVPASEVVALSAHTGGLKAKLDELANRVREQATAAGEGLEEAAKTIQHTVEQAVETVREQVVSKEEKPAEAKEEQAAQDVPQATEEEGCQAAEEQEKQPNTSDFQSPPHQQSDSSCSEER